MANMNDREKDLHSSDTSKDRKGIDRKPGSMGNESSRSSNSGFGSSSGRTSESPDVNRSSSETSRSSNSGYGSSSGRSSGSSDMSRSSDVGSSDLGSSDINRSKGIKGKSDRGDSSSRE